MMCEYDVILLRMNLCPSIDVNLGSHVLIESQISIHECVCGFQVLDSSL